MCGSYVYIHIYLYIVVKSVKDLCRHYIIVHAQYGSTELKLQVSDLGMNVLFIQQ